MNAFTQRLFLWGRQTTTVQGLAVLALTAVLQLTQAVPVGVVAATAATSLVLLILPGQGDLAGKIGKATADITRAIATRGDRASLGALAMDGVVLAGNLPPTTPVVPAVTP